MHDFINQLIERHANAVGNIQPRVSGRFDNDGYISKKGDENESWEGSRVESFQPQPLSVTVREDQDEKEPRKTENEKDLIAPERNRTTRDNELMGEKNEPMKKQQPSISVVSDNIQQKTNQISGTKPEPAPQAERLITRLQNRYLDKIQIRESTRDANLQGDDSNHTGKKTDESLPVLREPARVTAEETGPQLIAKENQAVHIRPKPEQQANQRNAYPSSLSNKTIPQTINISIDRIEIRAQYPPQVETRVIPKKEIKGIMALDEYLEKRKSR